MKTYLIRIFAPAFLSTLFFGYAAKSLSKFANTMYSQNADLDLGFWPVAIFTLALVGLSHVWRFRFLFPFLGVAYILALSICNYFIDADKLLFFLTDNATPFLLVMFWGWIVDHTTLRQGYAYVFPLVITYLLFSFVLYDYVLPQDPAFMLLLISMAIGFVILTIMDPKENTIGHGVIPPMILVLTMAIPLIFVAISSLYSKITIHHYYPSGEYNLFMGIFNPYLSSAIIAIFPVLGIVFYLLTRWLGWRIVSFFSVTLFGCIGSYLFFSGKLLGAVPVASIGAGLSLLNKSIFFPLTQLMILQVSLKWRFTIQALYGMILIPWLGGFVIDLYGEIGNVEIFAGKLLVILSVASLVAIFFIRPTHKVT